MAVRVKVNIESGNKKIECVAIANTGYETDEPEILIPYKLAKKYYANELKKIKGIDYKTFKGIFKFKIIGKCKVKVVTEDKESKQVVANLLSSKFEQEVLLNDQLIGLLEIDILNPAKGKWRFLHDALDKERDSELPEIW